MDMTPGYASIVRRHSVNQHELWVRDLAQTMKTTAQRARKEKSADDITTATFGGILYEYRAGGVGIGFLKRRGVKQRSFQHWADRMVVDAIKEGVLLGKVDDKPYTPPDRTVDYEAEGERPQPSQLVIRAYPAVRVGLFNLALPRFAEFLSLYDQAGVPNLFFRIDPSMPLETRGFHLAAVGKPLDTYSNTLALLGSVQLNGANGKVFHLFGMGHPVPEMQTN